MRDRLGAVRRHAAAAALVGVVLLAFALRVWNLDFDRRTHQHPDERAWALTAAAMSEADADGSRPPDHSTLIGPILDWLDADRSAANPYRVTDSFVYGPATMGMARVTAAWLSQGVRSGAQPAGAVAHVINALGIPLLDDEGRPRFDDAYQVDLIGRLIGAILDTATVVVVAATARRIAGRRAGILAGWFAATSVMAIQYSHFMGSEPMLGLCSAVCLMLLIRAGPVPDRRSAIVGGLGLGAAAGATVATKMSGLAVLAVAIGFAVVHILRRRSPLEWLRLGAIVVGAVAAFRVMHPGAFQGLSMRLSPRFISDLTRIWNLDRIDFPPAVQWARRIPVVEPLVNLVLYSIGPATAIAAAIGIVSMFRARRFPEAIVLIVVIGVVIAGATRSFIPMGRYFFPMLPAVYVAAGIGAQFAATQFHGRIRFPLRWVFPCVAGLWGFAFVNGVYGHPHTRISATAWIAEHVPPGSTLSAENWDDDLPLPINGLDQARWHIVKLEMFPTDTEAKITTLAAQLSKVDVIIESSPRVWKALPQIPAKYPSSLHLFKSLDDGSLGYRLAARFTSQPRLSIAGWTWFRLDDSAAEEPFSVYDHPEVRIWTRVTSHDAAAIAAILRSPEAATAVTLTPQGAWPNGLMLTPSEVAEQATGGTFADEFDEGTSPWLQAIEVLALCVACAAAGWVLLHRLLGGLPDAGAGIAPVVGLLGPAALLFMGGTWLGLPVTRGLVFVVVAVWLAAGSVVAWLDRHRITVTWRRCAPMIRIVAIVWAAAVVVVLALRSADPDIFHPDRSGEKPFELMLLNSVMRSRTIPPHDAWFAGGVMNYYYGGYLMLSVPMRIVGVAPGVALNVGLALVVAAGVTAAFTLGAFVVSRRVRGGAGPHRGAQAGLLAAALIFLLPNVRGATTALRWIASSNHRAYDWWEPSRVITNSQAINEFPAWSVIFGDLHPHLMDIGVLLATLVAAIVLAEAWSTRSRPACIAAGGVAGVLVGAVRTINTWDLPLAAGAVGVAALWAGSRNRGRWWTWALGVVGLGAGLAMWLPYSMRGEVFDSGVEPVPFPTRFGAWSWHWGAFAVAAVVLFIVTSRSRRAAVAAVAAVGGFVVLVTVLIPAHAVMVTCVILAALCAFRTIVNCETSARLAWLLCGAGWAGLAAIEHWSVANDAGRTNTVFKGWFQVWQLLAVGTAALTVLHLDRVGRATAAWSGATFRRRLLVAVVVVPTLAFFVAAVPARLTDRISTTGASLDGLDVLRAGDRSMRLDNWGLDRDDQLVAWLKNNVRGIVPVAEAPGVDYRWPGRIAALTGLPTVIGWPYHESQQRRGYADSIPRRAQDLVALYSTTDVRRAAERLMRYRIRYVVYGSAERRLGRAVALRRLPCVRPVVGESDSFVAEVDQGCLERFIAAPT